MKAHIIYRTVSFLMTLSDFHVSF